MSRLIWIYAVCNSVLDLQLLPFWQQRMCPNANMEEFISETLGWKSHRVAKVTKMQVQSFHLTFSSIQTNIDTFVNSADPDETARNEPYHQG